VRFQRGYLFVLGPGQRSLYKSAGSRQADPGEATFILWKFSYRRS